MFRDVRSGMRDDRTGLADLLAAVQPGDTLVVVALDRLGRSLHGILDTVAELNRRGVLLRSLREGIDFSTSTGKLLLAVFGALAEYERTLTLERAAAAREAARARGHLGGPPRALTDEQVALSRRMRAAGESVATIRKALGVGRSTLYRAWQEDGTIEASA